MSLNLHIDLQLQEITNFFSRKFPGFKLEFVFKGNELLNLSSALHHPFSTACISEIYPECTIKNITLNDEMTTREAEELLCRLWHLPATIYASVGGYWQKSRKTGEMHLNSCLKIQD